VPTLRSCLPDLEEHLTLRTLGGGAAGPIVAEAATQSTVREPEPTSTTATSATPGHGMTPGGRVHRGVEARVATILLELMFKAKELSV
jgi:hypothetical protein